MIYRDTQLMVGCVYANKHEDIRADLLMISFLHVGIWAKKCPE